MAEEMFWRFCRRAFEWMRFYRPQERLDILFMSPNFVAINKCFDVLINDNDPAKETVATRLAASLPHLVDASLGHGFRWVHRLDYSTSGVFVVALNKRAASAACASFSQRSVDKFYVALVYGNLTSDCIKVKAPISPIDGQNNKMKVAYSKGQRCASTVMLVLERGLYRKQPATKLMLKPKHGKRHQLRLHCKFIGHTIVGDYTYSDGLDLEPHRMFLHAIRLRAPNQVESLDIATSDPFTWKDPANNWTPNQVVHEVGDHLFEHFDEQVIQQRIVYQPSRELNQL